MTDNLPDKSEECPKGCGLHSLVIRKCPECQEKHKAQYLARKVEVERIEQEPIWEADASLILPIDIYAPWMRRIKNFLTQAKNGEHYRASVTLAGHQKGDITKPLYRVRWIARTEKGVKYLQSMAESFRALAQDTKLLDGENNGNQGT
jgi:hypothetical protein